LINYWELVKDFSVGDVVQQILPGQGVTPYVGRVLAVLPAIGFVDVQWPFGSERMSPEWLVRSSPEFASYLPPTVEFSYFPGMDVTKKARGPVRALWRTTQVPPGFHKDLARLFHANTGEVMAYDTLWRKYGSTTEDAVLRDEVKKFYRFALGSFDLLLQQHARKTATYWAAQNRQHRATRAEVMARLPNCPKCGTQMRRTTYKMAEGQKIRLFACPQDLYLIRQSDILGPDGSPVEW
jgi:hypothetical protein